MRLKEKSLEQRNKLLDDLNKEESMYMLFYIWDQQEFVLSLKRQIITETQI